MFFTQKKKKKIHEAFHGDLRAHSPCGPMENLFEKCNFYLANHNRNRVPVLLQLFSNTCIPSIAGFGLVSSCLLADFAFPEMK